MMSDDDLRSAQVLVTAAVHGERRSARALTREVLDAGRGAGVILALAHYAALIARGYASFARGAVETGAVEVPTRPTPEAIIAEIGLRLAGLLDAPED